MAPVIAHQVDRKRYHHRNSEAAEDQEEGDVARGSRIIEPGDQGRNPERDKGRGKGVACQPPVLIATLIFRFSGFRAGHETGVRLALFSHQFPLLSLHGLVNSKLH